MMRDIVGCGHMGCSGGIADIWITTAWLGGLKRMEVTYGKCLPNGLAQRTCSINESVAVIISVCRLAGRIWKELIMVIVVTNY